TPEAIDPHLLDLVHTALREVHNNVTVAGHLAISGQSILMTVGCLTLDHYRPLPNNRIASDLPCTLGDFCLCDNTFSRLTLAAFVVASIGTARLQDNATTECVGGFWLALADSLLPSPDRPEIAAIYAFWEYLYLYVLGGLYRLPTA